MFSHTVKSSKQTAPALRSAPKIFPRSRIDYRQKRIANGPQLLVIGNRIHLNVPLRTNSSGLPSRKDHIASPLRVGRKHDDQVSLFSGLDGLKFPPLTQLSQGLLPYWVHA